MKSIALARYRFHLRVNTRLHLPDYAGSTLRGIFGRALRELSCVTRARECTGCPLVASCPYSVIFDPQGSPNIPTTVKINGQLPVPYIIEAPLTAAYDYQAGEVFSFDLVLMGQALSHLGLIILAWRRALLRGVGKGGGTAELAAVEHILPSVITPIYTETAPIISEHSTLLTLPQFNHSQSVQLTLLTPLRIQYKNPNTGKKTILGAREFTPALFFRQLIRRVTMQLQLQQPDAINTEQIRALNLLADTVHGQQQLYWQDWRRYSSRQNTLMDLGGLMGTVNCEQVHAHLLPYLYLGQWLHLGKETSFGLGQYQCTSFTIEKAGSYPETQPAVVA